MSQIATFHLTVVSKLDELEQHARVEIIRKFFSKKIINHYYEYLRNNAACLYGLNADDLNGSPFITIISWLNEETEVELTQGRYAKEAEALTRKTETSTFIWTIEHKELFLSKIDIDNISLKELKRIGLDYSGDDSDETADALHETLQVMKNIMNRLENEQQVIVVSIG